MLASRYCVCHAPCATIAVTDTAAGKVPGALDKTNESRPAINRLLTIVLAIPALLLIVASLFATQEIVLTLAAPAVARSAADAVRGHYAMVTLRNLWLLFGGTLSVGLIIYSLDRLFKQSAKLSTRRYFLRLLAVEMVIIGAQLLFAS